MGLIGMKKLYKKRKGLKEIRRHKYYNRKERKCNRETEEVKMTARREGSIRPRRKRRDTRKEDKKRKV